MAFLYAIFLLTIFSSSLMSASDTLTAYKVLEELDFPVGLLPNGVKGYKLDNSTGKFSAYLYSTCTFKIESYELEYSSTITGVIVKDKISGLSGIKVKVLLLWLSIIEVIRDGDKLEFSVGVGSTNFPVSNFDECPTCGCGFDCNSHHQYSRKTKPDTLAVSSS